MFVYDIQQVISERTFTREQAVRECNFSDGVRDYSCERILIKNEKNNKIKGQALKEVKHISVYILVCSAVQQQCFLCFNDDLFIWFVKVIFLFHCGTIFFFLVLQTFCSLNFFFFFSNNFLLIRQ